MEAFCIVEDEIVGKFPAKEGFIMDRIKMIINELFLKGPVVAFSIRIDSGTAGIGEEVWYFVLL